MFKDVQTCSSYFKTRQGPLRYFKKKRKCQAFLSQAIGYLYILVALHGENKVRDLVMFKEARKQTVQFSCPPLAQLLPTCASP